MTGSAVQPFAPISIAAAGREAPAVTPAVEPDETWTLPGGTAWVWYGRGNSGLRRPVILSDGFSVGPSDRDELYDGLERGAFPLVGRLRERGHDLVLVGYDERSAPIIRNADVLQSSIFRTLASKQGDSPITVGGFSMGGIIARYVLAKLEYEGIDSQTAVYLSYDSPHRGAWIPISLQSLAHFLRPADPSLSNMVNSPAARELLWRHKPDLATPPRVDPMRTEFLVQLMRYGSWPQRPRRIAVANGVANGIGNGVPAGGEALKVTGGIYQNTRLSLQDSGDAQEVAYLTAMFVPVRVRTSGYPQTDGAPGGTLESFGIAADALTAANQPTEATHRSITFVPSVSAVAIRDLDTQEDLYADIGRLPIDQSEIDEFRCASENDEHTRITEELCTFILERLPEK